MRELNASLITQTIARLCVKANRNLPSDVCGALHAAAAQEPYAPARALLGILVRNEAIARGAYEAGVKVCSAYPGTPSTEITEAVAKYPEVYAEWAPNEKVATEAALGASVAGVRSFTAMKHVGLNVAADPLFTISYTGINAGMIIGVPLTATVYALVKENVLKKEQ